MTEITSPLVSIIIPCYNAEIWIGECLDSAIAQTYRSLEIIVIDDGSTDGSLSVIQTYAETYPKLIRYQTGPNRGGSAARNQGFALSNGEYILFLDADDFILPGTIKALTSAMTNDYRKIGNCDAWRFTRHGGDWIASEHEFVKSSIANKDDLHTLIVLAHPPPCSLLWHRRMIQVLKGWNETLLAYQDVEILFRALLTEAGMLIKVQGGGAYYRTTGASSVGHNNSLESMRSRMRVLQDVEEMLAANNLLRKYRIALGQAYYGHAVKCTIHCPPLSSEFLKRAYQLAGSDAITGTPLHKLLSLIFGLRGKIWLSSKLKAVAREVQLLVSFKFLSRFGTTK